MIQRPAFPRLTLGTVLAVSLFGSPASALYEDEAGALTVGASLRTTSVAVQNYDAPWFEDRGDGLNQSQFRLTLDGYPQPWFGYELHVVQDLTLMTSAGPATGFAGTGIAPPRYRVADGSWKWASEPDLTAELWLDRANVRYHFSRVQFTIGRQAVGLGKAQFWNPLDAFSPFDSRQFDREYKLGVDAARANVPLGDLSGVELVGVLGRSDGAGDFIRSWRGSAVLARAYTNWLDWDWAVQGGKVYGGYQLGGGFTGVLGPVELRAEAAYFAPMSSDPMPHHVVGVVGVGKYFDSSLNLQLEYLYNGGGDDDDLLTALERVEAGRVLQMSEHVLGGIVAYDLFPLLTGSFGGLVSVSDGSLLLLPQLEYSVSDESTLIAGAMLAAGARPRSDGASPVLQSEFGTFPNYYFFQYRVFF